MIIVSCNSGHKSFFDEKSKTEMLYVDETLCSYNNVALNKGNYSFKDCLKDKYKFDSDNFKEFEVMITNVLSEDAEFKDLSLLVFGAKNETLLNDKGYGLYEVNSMKRYPNLFFLRTEQGLKHYKCESIKKYDDLLNNSEIDKSLKTKISQSIKEECEKRGMIWHTGGRLH
jgi:hypothetical protein